MTDEILLPCRHLDGTTSIQCRFEGPYKYQNRGRPTQARNAFGDAETDQGQVQHMPFLMCQPAEEMYGHRDKPEDGYTYEWLVKEQRICSKFK